jgi:hypothetical protein
MFDQYDTKRWIFKIGVYLMKKKGAHLGLQSGPPEVPDQPQNTYQTRFGRYVTARNICQLQQDSAYSYIWIHSKIVQRES